MAKIVVGMSGGVDSAVTAFLLKAAGHDVVGATLKTWIPDGEGESRCCEITDASRTAAVLGIPFYVVRCTDEFDRCVAKPFVNEYLSGRTPSPCIECNRLIKWEQLLRFADTIGADLIATGHYASVVRLDNGRYTVETAKNAGKDQTYMLFRLTQEQLARTVMPLGKYSKDEVREIARAAGIPVSEKKDSQEICFIPDGDYASYIEEHSDEQTPGEGNFTDENGNVLGRHKGIIHYTVGQRKGLGIALGKPAYVKRIDAEKNEVVLSDDAGLYGSTLTCGRLAFMGIPEPEDGESFRARVKIRYRHDGENAVITRIGDTVRITFDKPVRAAAPGQSAVFYDSEGRVTGGGVILGQ